MIDQNRVQTGRRNDIVNEPKRAEDPEYIVWLIGKVICVNRETVRVVEGLLELGVGEEDVSQVSDVS